MSFNASYYFRAITRERANEILSGKDPGSFLVRKSQGSNDYALSIANQYNVMHYKIYQDSSTKLYCLENDPGPGFSTLDDLCQFHMREKGFLKIQLLFPVTSSKPIPGNLYYVPPKGSGDRPPQPISKNFPPQKKFQGQGNYSRSISDPKLGQSSFTGLRFGTATPQPPEQSNYLEPDEINTHHAPRLEKFNPQLNEPSHHYVQGGSLPSEAFAHEECEWFHGPISGDEAFGRLSKMHENHPLDGIFLVRSKTNKHFVLELISNKKTHKYEIHKSESTKLFTISDKIRKFHTLKELVDFLRVNNTQITGLQCELNLPCLKSIEKKPGFKNFFGKKKLPLSPTSANKPNTKECQLDGFNIERKSIKLEKVLGKGNFGVVKKGTFKVGSRNIECAIKILNAANKNHTDTEKKKFKDEFEKERDVMLKLNHPNIVKMLGMCNDDKGMLLVLELMPGGSLKEYLKHTNSGNFSEDQKLTIMLNICNGMKYLSQMRIIHRDLAARNILLDSQNIPKVADFGMARITKEGMYVQYDPKPGPLKWYAPECLELSQYTTKSDVWSFGVTMWETFTYGEEPFKEQSNKAILASLQTGCRLQKPQESKVEVYSIMRKCWKYDPIDRPDFGELYISLYSQY